MVPPETTHADLRMLLIAAKSDDPSIGLPQPRLRAVKRVAEGIERPSGAEGQTSPGL